MQTSTLNCDQKMDNPNYFKSEIEQAVEDFGDHGVVLEDVSKQNFCDDLDMEKCIEDVVSSVSEKHRIEMQPNNDDPMFFVSPENDNTNIDQGRDNDDSQLDLIDFDHSIQPLPPPQPATTESQTDDEQPAQQTEYIVDKILDKKVESEVIYYLVRWENYSSSSDSWEPLSNLVGCERSIEKFELDLTDKTVAQRRKDKGKSPSPEGLPDRPNQFELDEILGLTKIDEEKYFLISFKNGPSPSFIRSDLANAAFPQKVIDFYIRNSVWKDEDEASVPLT